MVNDMKWHIYDTEHNHAPLCWDDQALEFDIEEDAINFLYSAIDNTLGTDDSACFATAFIKKDILYYDGGYLDATGLILSYDAELCENVLIKAKKDI